MRELENKKIKILDAEIFYATLVKSCVENIPQGGLSIQEQKERLKIFACADKSAENMFFEEAESTKLKELASGMKWNVLSQELVDFVEAVQNMKAVTMIKKK